MMMAVQAAMAEGLISKQPVEPLARMLMGALHEGAMLIARSDDKPKTRADVGRTVEAILRGLENSDKPNQ